jgi:hypothetical protein
MSLRAPIHDATIPAVVDREAHPVNKRCGSRIFTGRKPARGKCEGEFEFWFGGQKSYENLHAPESLTMQEPTLSRCWVIW